MKRILVTVTVVAALAAAAVGAVVAGGSGAAAAAAAPARHTSMTLYLPGTSSSYVDTGTKGYSAGDYFLAKGALLDHKGGTRVGGLVGIWTIVSRAADTTAIVVHLPHGSMFVDGRIRHTSPSSTLRIAGGTGRYAHASGRMVFTYLSDTTASLKFRIAS